MSLLRTCLEGAALCALVATACVLVPRLKTGHRATLWWLVAAKLLIGLVPLPALELAAPLTAVQLLVAAPAAAPLAMPREAVAVPEDASDVPWPLWLWGASFAVLTARAVPGWRRTRDWRRAGRTIEDPGFATSVARAARSVGLSRTPRILAVPGLPGPLLTGLLSPCILLPAEALRRLDREELEMTLAHEMAHIARGDLWWGLVPALARRIFFFHPAAWIAEREYALAREAACDEAVLRPGADPCVYARLLLRFAARARASASIPMSAHSMLGRRLEMIESLVRRAPLSRAGRALVALAALSMIPVRLVANGEALRPKDEVTHCLDVGKDVESSYVITSGKSHGMCGDLSDVRGAEKARGTGGDVIWFRIGDDRWVIRDPAAVAEGRAYFLAIPEVGGMEPANIDGLGDRQREIGERALSAFFERSIADGRALGAH